MPTNRLSKGQVWTKGGRTRLVEGVHDRHNETLVTWRGHLKDGSLGVKRTCTEKAWRRWGGTLEATQPELPFETKSKPSVIKPAKRYKRFEFLMTDLFDSGGDLCQPYVGQIINAGEVHDALNRHYDIHTLDEAHAFGIALVDAWNRTLRPRDKRRRFCGVFAHGYQNDKN